MRSVRSSTRSMRLSSAAFSITRKRSRRRTSGVPCPLSLPKARPTGSTLNCSTSAPSGAITSVVRSSSGLARSALKIATSTTTSSNRNSRLNTSLRVKLRASQAPTTTRAMGPRRRGALRGDSDMGQPETEDAMAQYHRWRRAPSPAFGHCAVRGRRPVVRRKRAAISTAATTRPAISPIHIPRGPMPSPRPSQAPVAMPTAQ